MVDDVELRELVPKVLSVLVRRGADFATAEDAVQEAVIRALSAWEDDTPSDPQGWLITVSWRAFIDMERSDSARVATESSDSAAIRQPVWCLPSTTPCASTSCLHILT